MKHVAYSICVALILAACGKDGKDGAAGAVGPAGPQGEAGPAGANGTDNSFASILFCTATVNIPLNAFWTGMALTYQRAEATSGDVYVTAYTGGKGNINESGTSFYKKGMTGADKGKVTVGAGDGNYLVLESEMGEAGGVLVFQGRGTGGDVGQTFNTGCTKY